MIGHWAVPVIASILVLGFILGTLAYGLGDKDGKPFEEIWNAIHNLETTVASIPAGPEGPPGPDGTPGADGMDGADGLSCWDLNANQMCDLTEDVNAPVGCDALDCKGPQGDQGPPGADAGAELDAILDALSVVPEMCDGVDNNVNGETDEGFPVAEMCTAGRGECQASGETICSASGDVVCDATPGSPVAEEGTGAVCSDGLDNDCDGRVDEGPIRATCGACDPFAGCLCAGTTTRCTIPQANSPQCPVVNNGCT